MVRELEAKGIKVENLRMHGNGPGYSVDAYNPRGRIRRQLPHIPQAVGTRYTTQPSCCLARRAVSYPTAGGGPVILKSCLW